MKASLALSILAIAGLAATANAAQVTVSGGVSVPTMGTTGPLSANTNTALSFTGSGAGATVAGLVQATSTVGGNVQVLTLVLTNFSFTSTSATAVVIDVTIVQDYHISDPGSFATGSHQLNGNSTGSRNGNIIVSSMHESTNLPVLNVAFIGADPNIGANQGITTTVSPIDTIYTITTTYRFTIEGGVGSGTIVLPDSGVDNATLVLVPIPQAAYAGIGGLALAGLAVLRRRTQNHA